MSFEHATVTRGLMLGIALASISAGIFDVKHHLHLQMVPHITKYHQYWRVFTHYFTCTNSSDLVLTELVLFNEGITVERSFGSLKFSSFIIVNLLTAMIMTCLSLSILHFLTPLGYLFNYIPSGPFALLLSICYQYLRIVPTAYQFKIFGVGFTDKIWVYGPAIQLSLSYFPSTTLLPAVGMFCGYLYRSDLLQLKAWRVPHRISQICDRYSVMLLGDGRAARRTNRVLPDPSTRSTAGQRRSAGTQQNDPDVITTARPSQNASTLRNTLNPGASIPLNDNREDRGHGEETTSGGMMRQWVSELTGGTRPGAGGVGTVRAPSQAEVQTLTTMFPDVGRDVILGVLQRSPNIEAAAETLLRGAQS